jgi:predicted O-methyltransferase YrrM
MSCASPAVRVCYIAYLVDDLMPLLVRQAVARADEAGFGYSCDPDVGRLLAALAAHLPVGARVLELGTGTGVGTAWITFGLLPRTDVTVITVEKDPATAALATRGNWPGFVELRCADALTVLAGAGEFDLIFADAPGGKWEGLDRTIAALAPHGMLIVDDMAASPQWDAGQHARQREVRRTLLGCSLLTSVELDHGSGVILSTRRARSPA